MNRQGKTWDAGGRKMQSANKAFWEDIPIYNSKDIPWKIKCQRLVDHVNAVFFPEVKLGRDETFLPEKTKRDVGLLPDKNTHYGNKNNLGEDEIFFPVRTSIGKYVARHGVGLQ